MDLTGVKVGDELMMTDTNRSADRLVPVIKVGRKLLTVQEGNGRYGEGVYRIESGVKNDGYRHRSVETVEHYETRQERARVQKALTDHGLTFERIRQERALSTGKLKALLAVMEDESL
jgi:hypothetical protein